MHYLIGNIGHLFVLLSAVSAVFSFFLYLKASRLPEGPLRRDWITNGRVGFIVHTIAVFGVITCLFTIIYQHYFEYHYAFSHSSRQLPWYYMVSCFWEGQEGSFLLWMFWQTVLGLILVRTQKSWEAPVMSVFALVQAFLASMIMGVQLPLFEIKLGSSPFILLRDALPDPVFLKNPEFIPADGNGLNPLLQNYWMVIHPPTLFLGFAATLVPFSFCIAGLYYRQSTEWIRPALPWSLFAGAVLGIGILMGGYWAYETLSFGGYWNWDPVENAVYVPWLVLIAAIHTMMLYKSRRRGLRLTVILVLTSFLLILYSTFLTRSGILGDASVHSFTDLGLSGQLLVYLAVFVIASAVLVAVRWKHLPASQEELQTWNAEFWVFAGVATLFMMGFQVLIPTSFPVINKTLGLFGISSTLAPPADQIGFYSKLQLWFAVGLALLSGVAQVFWWSGKETGSWRKPMMVVTLISVLASLMMINGGAVYEWRYAILLWSGMFIIVSSALVLIRIMRKNPSISGGALTHVGVGLMLIGILFSSGYSTIVSQNVTGKIPFRGAPEELSRDHLLLSVNQPRTMAGYDIEFRGSRILDNRTGAYLRKSDINLTEDPFRVVTRREVVRDDRKLYEAGDTVEINPENTYYEIELSRNGQLAARLYPRVQSNPNMGMVISPDIVRGFSKDLYTHVSAIPNEEEGGEQWSAPEEFTVRVGENFILNDYVATLEGVKPVRTVAGYALKEDEVAAQARIRIQAEHEDFIAEPVFLLTNTRGDAAVGYLPEVFDDLGIRLTLNNIHPKEETFTIGAATRQKDWVIIKAIAMPWINVLWLGTGL